MKKQTRSFTLGLCFTLLVLTPTLGGAVSISNAPLFNSTAVEPNVFFVVDDSVNMEMDQMNADLQAQGQYVIANQSYRFLLPVNSSFGVASVLPSQQAVSEYNTASASSGTPDPLNTAADGVWRARNHNFNRIYYNPAVTYKPWQGANNAGASYTSISNPSSVPWNPYDSSSALINLTSTVSWSSSVASLSGSMVTVSTSGYYIPRYYEWTDTNGNGVVDANDAHVLHEIRTLGCSIGAVCDAAFVRPLSRSDCATPGNCTVTEELRNFANWWVYHRTRDKVVKAALSQVIYLGQNVRMGLSTTHNNSESRYELNSMSGAAKTDLMTQLFRYSGKSPGSPLKAALERAGNYYACGGSAQSNSNHFTYYPAADSDNVMTMTGNLFGNANCPIDSNSNVGRCQQNFTILISDGFDSNHGELQTWNGQPTAPNDPDWGGTVAGHADNVRLYNDPFGSNLVNADADSSNRFAGAPYADSYSDTLADVAMHFYKNDLSSHADDVPTLAGVDENPAQHMVTYGVALGNNGTLTDSDNPNSPGFSWPDPSAGNAQKIDDLRHAAFNGRGKFFGATNPEQLSSALNSSLKSVAERIGSAATVAFNTTTLNTDTSLYLALFNSTRWSGDLVSYGLDPNNGVINKTASWHAGELLDAMPPANRNLFTWNGSNGVNMNLFSNLSLSQQADLNMGPSGVADGLGAARLAYIRGNRSNENSGYYFRVRNSLLGDVIHSGPVFVGVPNLGWPDVAPFPSGTSAYSLFREAQASRPGTVYVGANDGSLHAFNSDTGEERFAYFPNLLFSQGANQGLHYLTDPAYTHKYYVDQTATVSDIFVNNAWKTVLIGALGAGGRGLYMLDITDPTTFNAAKVVGEFTSTQDANLGYTFSKPVIALTNALDINGNRRFGAILGNGYNSGGSGRPALFVVFLDADLSNGWQMGSSAGDDYMRIDVPADTAYGDTLSPNGLSSAAVIDTDGNGSADRVYAGDLKGNLWGFNLTTWTVAHQRGNGTKVPLFSTAVAQAITVRPTIIRHPDGTSYVVLFGTGSYMSSNDVDPNNANATQNGEFYGIYDKITFTDTITDTGLQAQTMTESLNPLYRIVSNNTVAANKSGWKITLNSFERVVTDPVFRGDIIYFNTTIPTDIPCDTGGSGWLMAVKAVSGSEPVQPVFDYNNDGLVNLDDKVSNGTHTPAGRAFDKGLPAASTILGDRRYTVGSQTTSGGEVSSDMLENLGGPGTGRLGWEQKTRKF